MKNKLIINKYERRYGDMVMIPPVRKSTELFHSIYLVTLSISYFILKKTQTLFYSLYEWSHGLYTAVFLQTKDTQCIPIT